MGVQKQRIVTVGLIVLGATMIGLGLLGPRVIVPPIVTGVGFFLIAWGGLAGKRG